MDVFSIFEYPLRGAVVEAIDAVIPTNIIASTVSDSTGNYSLLLPPNVNVFMRLKAQMRKSATPGSPASWSFSVRDNTNGNSLYVLDGANFITTAASTRNLRATAAVNTRTGAYTDRRSGPFAILDTTYQAFNTVLSADANVVFQPLDIFWSVANQPVSGNDAVGDIGTSSFRRSTGSIYILGREHVDTDEYDQHVVVHEWGHYFQHRLSRNDSLGGDHSFDQRLDLRVAFSEGWGNALAAMVLRDPLYRDSIGNWQRSGWSINIETAAETAPGWYGETTVQSVLYDLFDGAADGSDTVSIGFAPIYAAMINEVRTTNAFSTIFPLVSAIRARNPGLVANIDSLLAANGIVGPGNNDFGAAETNNGGDARNLPIYVATGVSGQVSVTSRAVISSDPDTRYNKLGNRRFVTFTLNADRVTTITVTGPVGSDVDAILYRAGTVVSRAETPGNTLETLNPGLLHAGVYVIEVFEFSNVNLSAGTARGDTVITVAIN